MAETNRLSDTARRSHLASRSHDYRKWLEETPNSYHGDGEKAVFYAAFDRAWQDRQAVIDRCFESMRKMSTRIRQLEAAVLSRIS